MPGGRPRSHFLPPGGGIGVAALVMLPESACGLAETARALRYLAAESAGQCGPCMFGVPSVAEAWRRLVETPTTREMHAVRGAAGLLPNRGACRFPDGVGRFAGSALRVLEPHLAAHASGSCPTERSGLRVHRA